MKAFNLKFLCADEVEYNGPCVSLTVPLNDGYVGILADHSNMAAVMTDGELTFNTGTETIFYAVTEGLVRVRDGEVLVLAYSAERPEEIDEKRAQRAAARARMELKKKRSELEYRQAQADLSRALNRLKVKRRG